MNFCCCLLTHHTSHDTCYKHVILFLYTLTWFYKPIAHRSLHSDINTGGNSSSSSSSSLVLSALASRHIRNTAALPPSGVHELLHKANIRTSNAVFIRKSIFLSCFQYSSMSPYSMSCYSYASHLFHHLSISSLFLIWSWLFPVSCLTFQIK